MAEKKKASLEENFRAIEQLLETMEAEDTTLEASFACYEKGMKLLKQCSDTLDRVEKRVLKLSEDGELSEFPE